MTDDEQFSAEQAARRRRTVALACRILAHAGLAQDVLGHVSVRGGPDRLFVRCRGPEDRGLLFTRDDDVRRVDLDGHGELEGGYVVPNEFPIHAEVLRARPEVGSVVHVHSPSMLVADLADLELAPVFGAYHIPAFRMARDGVPVYPRSVLVRTPELGRAVAGTLGGSPGCVLRGHGIVTVGDSVEQAVVRALTLHELARVTVELTRLEATATPVPAEDAEGLPDLGPAFNDLSVWRYHVGRLELAGLGG